jgi:hypothetical protein
MAQVVQPEQLVSLAYPAQRALLAWALLERQERWACLVPPGLQEWQALTVRQEPPASLEFLVLLVQPGSTGQQVLPELLVFQERQAPPESRAVMVLQAQQVPQELALLASPEQLEPLA